MPSLNVTTKSTKRETTTLDLVTLKLILETPIYTLERKRGAVLIYTSFRSSSYKVRKTTISSSLGKIIKVIEYKYNMRES